MDDCKVATFSLMHFVYLETEASKITPLFFVQSVISCHVPLAILQEHCPPKTERYKVKTWKREGLGAERNSVVCIMITFRL
jgi:hypothetical protein